MIKTANICKIDIKDTKQRDILYKSVVITATIMYDQVYNGRLSQQQLPEFMTDIIKDVVQTFMKTKPSQQIVFPKQQQISAPIYQEYGGSTELPYGQQSRFTQQQPIEQLYEQEFQQLKQRIQQPTGPIPTMPMELKSERVQRATEQQMHEMEQKIQQKMQGYQGGDIQLPGVGMQVDFSSPTWNQGFEIDNNENGGLISVGGDTLYSSLDNNTIQMKEYIDPKFTMCQQQYDGKGKVDEIAEQYQKDREKFDKEQKQKSQQADWASMNSAYENFVAQYGYGNLHMFNPNQSNLKQPNNQFNRKQMMQETMSSQFQQPSEMYTKMQKPM